MRINISHVMNKYLWFLLAGCFAFFSSSGQQVLTNPLLAGFYPDPSICRVGKDYYLINSTFAYFPGIPVFHSRDLQHWEQLGNVITRDAQLNFLGDSTSRGLFAPALSYHNGKFYVSCTLIDHKGNFIVSASDPAGPWSDPVWIPEVKGIDPSLFFDGGRLYLIYNSEAPHNQPLYDGHRSIRLYELDPESLKVIGRETLLVNGGVDLRKKPVWIEGPHLFKRDGFYYLIAAEGGTGTNHSEVVFRSTTVRGPYIPFSGNPVLTQKHLDPDRKNPVTSTGHAELVEGPDGRDYAVFLAARPYQGDYYNTGRETFIAPVSWEDGWPVINKGNREVQYKYTLHNPAENKVKAIPTHGNFTYTLGFQQGVSLQWLFLRSADSSWRHIDRQGRLRMKLLSETCMGTGNPAFMGKRQQHLNATAETSLSFTAAKENEKAGLTIFQNEYHFYFLSKSVHQGQEVVQLYKGDASTKDMVLISQSALKKQQPLSLRIQVNRDLCSFFYREGKGKWTLLKAKADAKYLSTKAAGGFTGCLFALYATSGGLPSQQEAAFTGLKYKGEDPVYK